MNPLSDAIVQPLSNREDAVLVLQDGSAVSGVSLFEMTGRISNALKFLGVRPGDRVAMQADKSHYSLALYLACLRSGVLFLPLNTAYTDAELEYFIGDSGAKVVVCDPLRREGLGQVAEAHAAQLLTLAHDGSGTLLELADDQSSEFDDAERDADDLVAILYTSGMTGRSKGAMLTQKNLLSNTESLADAWQFTDEDVLLHALPIFHVHGLFVACNLLLKVGGKMIFLPRLNVDQLIQFMPQATTMMGVPTFYTRLLADERFDANLTSHMRLFISGSAPLLAETHVQFEERTGHKILERYGMTETSMSTSNPYEGERKAGSVGLVLPGVEARIVDGSGREVGEQEVGILEVRGPNVFKGYWQMPEKTAEEFREDGFFITGDMATIDAEGYISIVGRSKDLIISGGYNVYPKEIETEIDLIEGVSESAVFGVPHPDFGEAVIAAIVPKDGFAVEAGHVTEQLAGKLAKFKQPKKIEFLSELPRNTMGKVQKNILRNEFKSLFD